MSPNRALENLRICYLGHHSPEYARSRILAKALRRAGADVTTVTDGRRYLARTPNLFRRASRAGYDMILVGFPGHADVATARAVAAMRGPRVMFDAFVSLWETAVCDRGTVRARSLSALRYRLEDRLACALADIVLLDTDSHCDYFSEELGVPAAKLRTVRPGADDDVMRPWPQVESNGSTHVFFYGSFIPLQGVEHIVRAAHLLECSGFDVRFSIVGSGQTRPAMEGLTARLGVSNVHFLGRRPYETLPLLMAGSDLCLGIFGTTPKARRVIPNKVFDALACARPVITSDSPAARECFTHRENIWLCPPGDAEALAEAISILGGDENKREQLARAGHSLFKREFSVDSLAERMTTVVSELLER